MTPLMVIGWKRPLQMEDLPVMLPSDKAVYIAARFRKHWFKQYVPIARVCVYWGWGCLRGHVAGQSWGARPSP